MQPMLRLSLLLLLVAGSWACTPVMKGLGNGLLLATGVGQPAIEEKATQPKVGYLKVVSGQEALFVLGFVSHGQEIWYGPESSVLTLTQGVVQRTSGLGNDLLDEVWLGEGARYLLHGLHTLPVDKLVAVTKRRSLDSDYRWQVDDQYQLKRVGMEPVSVWAGQKLNLLRVEELPVNTVWPGNVYWVMPETGEMVASQQWLSPQRRFAMLPREPHDRRAMDRSDLTETGQESRSVEQAQRLSAWLLANPAYARVLPANLVVYTSRWPTTAAQQLHRRVQLDLRQAQAATQGRMQQSYKNLAQWLALTSARPRLPVVSTDPYWLQANPTKDPILQVGDELSVREAVRDINVIRTSGQRCRAAFSAGRSLQGYLDDCDSAGTGLNSAWVLQPDGVVSEQGIALWNKSARLALAPGAWLVMLPNEYSRHAGDQFAARHLLQLLHQLEIKP